MRALRNGVGIVWVSLLAVALAAGPVHADKKTLVVALN